MLSTDQHYQLQSLFKHATYDLRHPLLRTLPLPSRYDGTLRGTCALSDLFQRKVHILQPGDRLNIPEDADFRACRTLADVKLCVERAQDM